MADPSPYEMIKLGGIGDGQADNSPVFTHYVALLQERGGGTIAVPDGVYGLSEPLILPPKIHLQMTPGATLLALPGFQGDVVVQIGETGKNLNTGGFPNDQYLLNGKIDGNKQPLVGLRQQHPDRVDNVCPVGVYFKVIGLIKMPRYMNVTGSLQWHGVEKFNRVVAMVNAIYVDIINIQ